MSRRALTLLLSGLFAVLLTAGAASAQVPYVSLGPGPTYNTLGDVGGEAVLEIEGRETFPTDGRLDLTTVGVQQRLTLAEALTGWFRSDRAVVPRELVFPADRTDAEIAEQNAAQMVASQSSAITAALNQLGVPFTTDVVVGRVEQGLPADGELEVGDVITAVDGRPVADATELREAVEVVPPGTPLPVSYVRDGRPDEVVLQPVAAPDDSARSIIGIALEEQPEYGFDITINLEDVGGPSAGLIFALGILDKLEPGSLTAGRYIAGTGVISDDGNVGPIGGIAQKLIASEAKGVEAFLVPADNCAEALASAPPGLVLVKVSTLQDALDGLAALREGETPVDCAA